LAFNNNGMVKKRVHTDLNKSNWYALKSFKYFTTVFISENAITLNIMYKIDCVLFIKNIFEFQNIR